MKSTWLILVGLFPFFTPQVWSQSYSPPYYYTNNADNTVTITGYNGPGGAVIIPAEIGGESVITIGDWAFDNNTNITSVTIPNSVTTVGRSAFGDCFALSSVLLSDSVTNVEADAFYECSSLTSISLPNSVSTIGMAAFMWCGSLTNVALPDSVTSLGADTFAKCFSLTSIDLPSSVTSIENSTFWEAGLTNITVPNTVTNIANYAFWYCSNLSGATIGGGVTSIGIQVFSFCPNLTAINVAPENPAYTSEGGVLFDKNYSTLIQYPEGNAATSYSIPEGVSTIGEYSFLDCPNLMNVTIGQGVTNLGFQAFALSAGLTNIAIPNSVTTIGEQAFSACVGLTNVVIGNDVGNIQFGTFAECSNLDSITIASGVTNIEVWAFYGTGLVGAGVYFTGNAPACDPLAFEYSPMTAYYLPGTSGWDSFSATTGMPTELWNPQIQAGGSGFGITNNQFGFAITGPTNLPVAVKASTNLGNPVWTRLQTVTLTNGSYYFRDPQWSNFPSRYYGLGFP